MAWIYPDANSYTDYNAPAGLTVTTVYTRYAKDATCNTSFTHYQPEAGQ